MKALACMAGGCLISTFLLGSDPVLQASIFAGAVMHFGFDRLFDRRDK